MKQVHTWVQEAVIGLNLCPFASKVEKEQRVRYVLSEAQNEEQLYFDFAHEMIQMENVESEVLSTTLLVPVRILSNFEEFNDFVHWLNDILEELKINHIVQIASFHPEYQFDNKKKDDITNFTNRSPYPVIQILRQKEVTSAIEGPIDTLRIPDNNMAKLEALGVEGVGLIWCKFETPPPPPPSKFRN